jgi:hypothetical protein
MVSSPQYVDLSSFNPKTIDWQVYKKWASMFNGVSHVALRATQGTGDAYVDTYYKEHRAQAEAAGIDTIFHYHYAYPQFNEAKAEADWMRSIVGDIRPGDVIMLDFEESVEQATADWALAWLERTEENYGEQVSVLYSYDAYVRQRLNDSRLAKYPLILAHWTFDVTQRPPCPLPWSEYLCLQYTDRATNIPGIQGAVDANIYLGPEQVDYKFVACQQMFKAMGQSINANTAIYQEFVKRYMASKFLGPAVTDEISHQRMWDGTPVTRRYFLFGWIEWNETNGEVAVYSYSGRLK